MNPPNNLCYSILLILLVLLNPIYSANNTEATFRQTFKYRRGISHSNQTATDLPSIFTNEESTIRPQTHRTLKKQLKPNLPSDQLHPNDPERIIDSWNALDSIATRFTNRLVYQILEPTFDDLFTESDVSIGCQSAIRTVLRDAARMKKYAVQSK